MPDVRIGLVIHQMASNLLGLVIQISLPGPFSLPSPVVYGYFTETKTPGYFTKYFFLPGYST